MEPGESFRRMIASQAKMNLRDEIAATILSSLVKESNVLSSQQCKEAVMSAYRLADAAIEVRSKKSI